MNRFYMASIECSRGQIDTEKIRKYFQANNIKQTDFVCEADFVYIGTCAFTQYAEEKAVALISGLIQSNSKAKFIVGGCLPDINKQRLLSLASDIKLLSSRDLKAIEEIVGKHDKLLDYFESEDYSVYIDKGEGGNERIARRIRRYLFEFGFSAVVYRLFNSIRRIITRAIWARGLTIEKRSERSMIEISRGCLGNCSYCAVKFAKGKLHSRMEQDILQQFRYCIKQGYSRIRLVAVESGSYGRDIKTDFPDLIKKIVAIDGCREILIDGMNPYWLIKYSKTLTEIFSNYKGKIAMVVSIQSGNDRILAKMNRKYTSGDLRECMLYMKNKCPDLEFYANIIVGFPGEKESEFKDTVKLIKALDLEMLFTFKYSSRPNIESEKFTGKIGHLTKLRRMWHAEFAQILVYIRKIMKKKGC